ncbi:unnamed protein product [Schistosoma mattheei]|uniref:Uncharacterized protein n=1 Tax=Schistosoma mattheei TaxID=31246 RepID=A0A183PRP6_9TREM|nr:unnamed protein product [Schistosoma mattheei]
MNTSTSDGKHGIQWTAQNKLEDLDFANDIALLSHAYGQMQMKTVSVSAASAVVGLNIHKGKTKTLKYNTVKPTQSCLTEKLCNRSKPSRAWEASSMNKEDLMQT